MKKQNDTFLTTYKALEKELTDMGLSIKDYEDRLVNDGNTDAADKLRLCRMIRNYLSHHADGDELVTVNNNLSAFIKGLIIIINNTKLKAKDSYVPVSRSKRLIRKPESVREYGIEHEKINLEITESASLNEKHSLLDNMSKFIEKGIKFSLDDFGSGESNLNYIIDMPVSIIKFDKDMTDAYFKSEKAKIVMDSAINMIHKLGLKTVVEGVETKEQFDAMLKIQTDYIQGYYFSKPLDVNDFVEYVLTSETKK